MYRTITFYKGEYSDYAKFVTLGEALAYITEITRYSGFSVRMDFQPYWHA